MKGILEIVVSGALNDVRFLVKLYLYIQHVVILSGISVGLNKKYSYWRLRG